MVDQRGDLCRLRDVTEVDRNLLERAHCVHSKKQRRFFVEPELLERVGIGENHRKIAEGDAAQAQLANEGIFAADLVTRYGLELHHLRVARSPAAEKLA